MLVTEPSSLWTAENPARGQCGVTTLVIQKNCFGGKILKTTDGASFYNEIDGCNISHSRLFQFVT